MGDGPNSLSFISCFASKKTQPGRQMARGCILLAFIGNVFSSLLRCRSQRLDFLFNFRNRFQILVKDF